MAWSPTKTSIAGGNWNTPGTWSPSGVPGQDDYVQIGHIITIDTAALAAGIYVTGSGARLQWNPGMYLTIKDALGTHAHNEHIWVKNDLGSVGGFYSWGNYSSFCLIKSQNPNPTYRIKMMIEDVGVTSVDSRQFRFDFMELRDFMVFLGNDTNFVWFNTGDVSNDGIIGLPPPIRRDQKFSSHFIDGRPYGRVQRMGGHSGLLELEGIMPWKSFAWQILADLRDSGERCSFISQFVSMPKARVESFRPGRRDGLYLPFTVGLIEDL